MNTPTQNKSSKDAATRQTKPSAPAKNKQAPAKAGCPHESCIDPEVCRTIYRCKLIK